MGINFNFGLGGKTGNNDDGGAAGQAGATTTDPNTAVVADPNAAASTPPPTEPIMADSIAPAVPVAPAAPVAFGDDITINVTDAPNIAEVNAPAVGEVQMTEVPAEAAPVAEAVPVAEILAAPVVAEEAPLNPFGESTPTNEIPPATDVVVEAAPLNPFAENTEARAAAAPVSTDNPFAVEAATPAVAEEVAVNPFETQAPATEAVTPEAPATEMPAVDLTPAPLAENPFAATQETQAAPEAPAAEMPAVDLTPAPLAENPFAATQETEPAPEQTPALDINFGETADEPAATEAAEEVNLNTKSEATPVMPSENPFADNSAASEDEDTAVVVEEEKEEEAPTPPHTQTSGNGSNPLKSLKNIKAEIAGFVALHNQNVADYKSQIKGLETKINEEKELLKKRKGEFRNMLGEIEALTQDFGGNAKQEKHQEKGHDSNDDHQNKPKKKRNRKKKNNSEQKQEQGDQN